MVGFSMANGEANRDNSYILDNIVGLTDIPVNVVHGRYDRVCHLYQAETLVRALRSAIAIFELDTDADGGVFQPERMRYAHAPSSIQLACRSGVDTLAPTWFDPA